MYTAKEYAKLSAAEKQYLYQIRKEKTIDPRAKGGNRSVSLTLTDNSSSRKRSVADSALKDDTSDENGSLFPDSNGDMTDTDKRAKNCANARQSSR